MRTIQSQITINQPKEKVWAILSDITAMENYMPGVQNVQLISENSQGIGAARHCTFEDGVELQERVIKWDEGNKYTLETTKFVNVPMKENQITFSLRPNGSNTQVTQSMEYKMKGGIFAPVMELMAKGMMTKAINGALGGLKAYAEEKA